MEKLIYSMLLFSICFSSKAQYYSNGNYASSLEFSTGYVEDGFGATISYNYHINVEQYLQGAFFFSSAVDKETSFDIPYQLFIGQLQWFYTLWKEPRYEKLHFTIGGGGLFGHHFLNNGKIELSNGHLLEEESSFVYGGVLTAAFSFSVSDNWSLVAKSSEYILLNSDLGMYFPYLALGVRYTLY